MDAAKLAAFMCGDTKQVGNYSRNFKPDESFFKILIFQLGLQKIDEIYGVDLCVGNRLPLLQVNEMRLIS